MVQTNKGNNMFLKTKYLFLLLLLSGLLWFAGCSLEQVAEEKNGILYGVTKGTFRDRWWNYYERGMSFADGGFWEKAEADLCEAVQQRNDDQRRARTYGRHFIDYFPHCELGVVLYNQGRIKEAISELETSLSTVKFAKAEYYLDLARKSLVEKEQQKQGAPEIIINQPGTGYILTNAFSAEVRGIAKDDNNFIRYISVGDKKIRIDVSGRKIPFQAEVPVSTGINRIPVRAVSLTGKSSEISVTVNADHTGPLISIDSILENSDSARVLGYAFDDSGLAEIAINGQKFLSDGKTRELLLDRTVHVKPGQKELIVNAADIAGNITSAAIPLPYRTGTGGFFNLLAENSVFQKNVLSDGTEKHLSVPNNNLNNHPFVKINLNNPETERTTYLDRVVIDGKISSHEKMTKLFVNGNEILQSPRRNFYFCYIAKLKQGENLLNITALAPSHHSDAEILKIKREITCVRKPEARLKLALNDFTKEKTEDVKTQMSVGFENRLAIAMLEHSPRRFSQVRNLKSGDDCEKLRKTARAKGFHCIMFGHILERRSYDDKNSIIISARVEDTEYGDIIVETQDVYEEADKDTIDDKLKFLSEIMKLKLIDELPIVEGRILEKHKNEWIAVNLGKEKKVKKGMELIVYQKGKDILGFDVTDQDTEQLGEAKIKAVKTEESLAYLKETSEKEKIQPKHRVITR